MSKYDFEIDLSVNSSTGLILDKIAPGSVVLEFGCAAGRMTRYMKEAMDCTVYIVEYDRPAYEKAAGFAADGVCGDIMDFEWLEKFGHIRFDTIIFADVLEHLSDPSLAVKKAAGLLKPDGKILVSLPNITHNDVLRKLYENRFDYTPTGILDDTHVYFRGMENLSEMFADTGVFINTVQATYCPAGYTEQYGAGLPQGHIMLNNLLKERQCGEIYQFVLTLSLQQTETEYLLKKPVLNSNIYLDTGRDFNSDEIIPVECVYADGIYHLQFDIESDGRLKKLRFDPVEGQGCIVKNLEILQNGIPADSVVYNGFTVENGILFSDTDPMIIVECSPEKSAVTLSCDVILPGEKFISEMYSRYSCLFDENTQRLHQLGRYSAQLQSVSYELQVFAKNLDTRNKANIALSQHNYQLKRNLALTEKQNREYTDRINSLTAAVASLETDVGAYNMLVNVKEKYIMELERELNRHITYRLKVWFENMLKKAKPFLKKFLK